MDFFRRFTFLFCAPAFDAEDLEGHRLDQITVAIRNMGFQVVHARRIEDAELVVQTDAAIGCMVVDWGKKGREGKTAALINLMRKRGLEMPIVILVRRKRLEDIPVEVQDYIDGYIFLAEETPEFIAKNLVSRLKQYAEVEKIGRLCDYILFDEAWAGFMKFHPIYAGRLAMGLTDLGPGQPGIIATQSTHKQLASFSQASQIHFKDRHIEGQRRRVEHRRFNEFFMLHASTSPFYPLFASLDVGAQMMKGRSGEVLWDDTIRLGIELRKKVRAIGREFRERERDPARHWFFETFVPDRVTVPGRDTAAAREMAWEDVPTDELATHARYWELAPGAAWHGFTHVAPGHAITDPNKLILLTPGFGRDSGGYAEHGIPAPVVAQYLRENQVVPEKNDLNSLLFLLTPGVESSKAGTLLSTLVAFKKLYDDNARLDDVIGEFVRRRPARYSGVRLRDLCSEMG